MARNFKMRKLFLTFSLLSFFSSSATWAVPALQIGVADGLGGYVDYTTVGNDQETAFTHGNVLSVAGAYQNSRVLNLGGKFGKGPDWSGFHLPSAFDGQGALLLISVANGTLANGFNGVPLSSPVSIAIDNGAPLAPIWASEDTSFFPNFHFPVKDEISDFYFFNLGNFSDDEIVPDFASETGTARGEIKEVVVSTPGLLTGFHADVIALSTERVRSTVKTSVKNNPGSHDVTSDFDGDHPGGHPIPEPSVLALLGLGLIGLMVSRIPRST